MDKNRVLWELNSAFSPSLPLSKIAKDYNEAMKTTFGHLINTSTITPVVYTPMHGVGQRYVDALFHSLGLPLPIVVDAQSLPDPNFPTVKFPNPEEGKGALSLAMATADYVSVSVVFANDPDVDRFNMAEKQPSGDWKIFNGNEIALLLADFAWRNMRDNNKDPSEYCMLASLVSSRILSKMAAMEGFFFEQAATGFKNLSNTGQEMQAKGKTVLFTYEEAIGFMVGTNVWDKDGISSLLTAYLLLQEVSAGHQTLRSRLDALWQKYGYQIQFNSYFYHQSASALKPIIAKLPGQLAQLKEITFKDDLLLKIDHIKASNVIFLEFQSGAWIAIRASGTEPKIKFYSEIIIPDSNRVAAETERLRQLVLAACNVLLDPVCNGLSLQENA
jgi:phosphoglucomutase/phosphopentomutase